MLLFCQHLTTIKLYASLLYQYGDLNSICRAFCTLCKHRLSILRRMVCTLIHLSYVFVTVYFVCKVRSGNRQNWGFFSFYTSSCKSHSITRMTLCPKQINCELNLQLRIYPLFEIKFCKTNECHVKVYFDTALVSRHLQTTWTLSIHSKKFQLNMLGTYPKFVLYTVCQYLSQHRNALDTACVR